MCWHCELQNWFMLQAQFLQPTIFACCFTLSGLSPCLSWLLAKHVCLLITWQMKFLRYRFTCLVLMIFALPPLMLHCPSLEHLSNLHQVCNLHGATVKLCMGGFYENQTGLSPWEPWKAKSPWLFCPGIHAMHIWISCQWPEEIFHQKLQVYKPRIM